MNSIYTDTKVTRFEVIDNRGRAYVKYDVKVQLSYQDDGQTLKIFVYDKGDISDIGD